MSTNYSRNQPVASDDLAVSQTYLYDNTNAADTIFGYDHYAFSDNNDGYEGLHKQVTTVPQAAIPVTVDEPIFISYDPYPTSQLPNLQFSLGVNGAFPTPLTKLQSPSTPISLNNNAVTNIFDFVNIPRAMFRITIADYVQTSGVLVNNIYFADAFYDNVFIWNSATARFYSVQVVNVNQNKFDPISYGTLFTIRNKGGSTLNNIYWTLEFLRIG